MRANSFIPAEQLSPVKLADALRLVKDGYRPVAGGSDLIIRQHTIATAKTHSLMKEQSGSFKPVFYAGRIKELLEVKVDGSTLKIGSSVTLSRLIADPRCPDILSDALESIASPGIRNIATLTGNICNASPAGDSLPPLYVLNAVIDAASIDANGIISSREIPIERFITGPGRTILEDHEFVTSVNFPLQSAFSGIFRKVGTRAANALSKLSIAALWENDGGLITDFRLAVGACGPTVIRSGAAEDLLTGCSIAGIAQKKDEVLSIYSNLLSPIDDQRSSAEYRKNTALRLIDNIISTAGGLR